MFLHQDPSRLVDLAVSWLCSLGGSCDDTPVADNSPGRTTLNPSSQNLGVQTLQLYSPGNPKLRAPLEPQLTLIDYSYRRLVAHLNTMIGLGRCWAAV